LPRPKVPWGRLPDPVRSKIPTAAMPAPPSPRVAGLYTFGDGQAPSSPQDVRLTSFVQSDDHSYLSPSLEISSYASGSSQVQEIRRTASSLVIGHDALGRRSFELDSRDPVRSRRDYRYLPNGQLGQVLGQTPDGAPAGFTIRYDERGRPILLTGPTFFPLGQDRYELFWDDADRLIAANILFSAPRFAGADTGWVTSARWHYHYLGSMLLAATRELVTSPTEAAVKRFWVASDERGLVHRFVDDQGATYWQARWDATGWRTWIGQPQPEMWVPFGLPGQIVLGKTVVFDAAGESEVTWGTEAVAADPTGTWTRPPIALNQWRAYDPLLGAFLKPDLADQAGRLSPEAFAYGRSSPAAYADEDGLLSSALYPWDRFGSPLIDISCGYRFLELNNAIALAFKAIEECFGSNCTPGGPDDTKRRLWLHSIASARYKCPNGPGNWAYQLVGEGRGYYAYWYDDADKRVHRRKRDAIGNDGIDQEPFVAFNDSAVGRSIADQGIYLAPYTGPCLAETVAHEAAHSAFGVDPKTVPRGSWSPSQLIQRWPTGSDPVHDEIYKESHRCLVGHCQ
jgi:hypothetical protein